MNDFDPDFIRPPHHPRYLNTEFVGHMFPTKHIDNVERVQEHVDRHARVHDLLGARDDFAGESAGARSITTPMPISGAVTASATTGYRTSSASRSLQRASIVPSATRRKKSCLSRRSTGRSATTVRVAGQGPGSSARTVRS